MLNLSIPKNILAKKQVNGLQDIDKRYFPRWSNDNRVLYRLECGSQYQEGKMKDLNCAGGCVYVDDVFSNNDRINLIVYLSPKKKQSVSEVMSFGQNHAITRQG